MRGIHSHRLGAGGVVYVVPCQVERGSQGTGVGGVLSLPTAGQHDAVVDRKRTECQKTEETDSNGNQNRPALIAPSVGGPRSRT